MSERAGQDAEGGGQFPELDFGKLVFEESIRRALRKTPQERLDMLCASLRDAEKRGMIPKRDRKAHEEHLLRLIQGKPPQS